MTGNGSAEGLFTGYYEPLLDGSRHRGGAYQTPLLRRPADLVMVQLGLFRPEWRGERIAGRVVAGNLVPYPSRAEIERGALDTDKLALYWVADPVDAFFLEVQGSGKVRLPDGRMVSLGYDGQNGRAYVSIGKLLIERGQLTKDQVSLGGIKRLDPRASGARPGAARRQPVLCVLPRGQGRDADRRRGRGADARAKPCGGPRLFAARRADVSRRAQR